MGSLIDNRYINSSQLFFLTHGSLHVSPSKKALTVFCGRQVVGEVTVI
jgi:hypothetical protein